MNLIRLCLAVAKPAARLGLAGALTVLCAIASLWLANHPNWVAGHVAAVQPAGQEQVVVVNVPAFPETRTRYVLRPVQATPAIQTNDLILIHGQPGQVAAFAALFEERAFTLGLPPAALKAFQRGAVWFAVARAGIADSPEPLKILGGALLIALAPLALRLGGGVLTALLLAPFVSVSLALLTAKGLLQPSAAAVQATVLAAVLGGLFIGAGPLARRLERPAAAGLGLFCCPLAVPCFGLESGPVLLIIGALGLACPRPLLGGLGALAVAAGLGADGPAGGVIAGALGAITAELVHRRPAIQCGGRDNAPRTGRVAKTPVRCDETATGEAG